jgi:hypothetical protein
MAAKKKTRQTKPLPPKVAGMEGMSNIVSEWSYLKNAKAIICKPEDFESTVVYRTLMSGLGCWRTAFHEAQPEFAAKFVEVMRAAAEQKQEIQRA